MSDIKEKALALVKRFYPECPDDYQGRRLQIAMAAIEQHEAFRQEVSDAVINSGTWNVGKLKRFIIPAPKPDPLEQVIAECDDGTWETIPEYAEKFRAALEARGLEIKEKEQ